MDSNMNIQREIIETVKVYSKNEQVFIKTRNKNWLPISFRWVQSGTSFHEV